MPSIGRAGSSPASATFTPAWGCTTSRRCAFPAVFGTTFSPFEHSEENVQLVFDWTNDIDQTLDKDEIARYSLPSTGTVTELEKDRVSLYTG